MADTEKVDRRRIGGWLARHHVGYKLLAVLLSFLLWYYVAGQRDPIVDRTFTRQVEPRNLSAQLILASSLPRVNVTVHGVKSLIRGLNDSDVNAYVDLAGQGAGQLNLPVKVDVPYGLEVTGISPGNVRVNADFLGEKRVPVRLIFTGTPANGYTAQPPVINPAVVTLQGPNQMLQKIDSVEAVLSLTGASNNIKTDVPIRLPKNYTDQVRVQPAAVSVSVQLIGTMTKSVPVAANYQGTLDPKYKVQSVTVDPVTVQITGRPDAVNKVDELRLAPIDISGASANVVRTVPLTAPAGVTIPGTKQVTVTIQIVPVNPEQLHNQ